MSAGQAEPSRLPEVSDIQSYHVEWFVTREAFTDVTVQIVGGRVQDIIPGRTAGAVELGDVALVAGLVNAHTHLEFSDLVQPIVPTGQFTDWIRAVIRHRQARPPEASAIDAGIEESLQCGTTLIGEIATSDWINRLPSPQPPCVVFRELLGLSPERVAEQRAIAGEFLELSPGLPRHSGSRRGLSPHAPYSTHQELVRQAVSLAQQTACPLAMHLAETEAELELLESGRGEFREFLKQLGLWKDGDFPGNQQPMDYLELLAAAPRALVIHGNYLNDAELNFIANSGMALVYCPRTHAAFGHAPHPWRRLKELGGCVAIGTDSRASNPDLSVFAELQFLASLYPELSHVDLLQLGSIEGRRALGMEATSDADFTLIRLNRRSISTPRRSLFASENTVAGTMLNGRWAWLADDLSDRVAPLG